jgi:hypothetical protein
MKKYLVLLVPLLLSLSQCYKEPAAVDSTVNGRLVEFGNTQKGVPNVDIGLLARIPPDCLFCPEKQRVIGWAASDADGRFSFTFLDTSTIYHLAIRPRDKKYYPIDLFELKEDKKTKLHGNPNLAVEVIPQAFIRFRIKNVNPFNRYDMLNIERVDEYWRYEFVGMNVDTTVVATLPGNMKRELRTIVNKNTIQTIIRDSVTTVGHDTIDVKIFY